MFFILTSLLLISCGNKPKTSAVPQEDREAKRMLQGIWKSEDGNDVAFRVKGDSIFYPDTTSLPVSFQVLQDTLVLHGSTNIKYPIVKQSQHLLMLNNQNGDVLRLVKSDDPADAYAFIFTPRHQTKALNQRKLIKRDTIVAYRDKRYHCYVQVNPTTYKVITPSYTDDGLEVDNVYYDNIIHLAVYNGSSRLFSRDFYKRDFSHIVPKEFLERSVLSDFTDGKADAEGIHYTASLALPDGPSSYEVDVCVAYSGKMNLSLYER